MNYYNDNDPFISKWLKELIKANLIPDGEVDDRSITDIEPKDLKGYDQHHFFAGIAGWPRALDLAGWDSTRSVWSASLPCQPLSVAGQQKGHEDDRHLWPIFHNLVKELRPPTIIGEQVASKDGREWLTGIFFDLEALGYAVAAADLPAASVGAPHKRNRLFWCAVANAIGKRSQGLGKRRIQPIGENVQATSRQGPSGGINSSPTGRLADSENDNGGSRERRAQTGVGQNDIGRRGSSSGSPGGGLADSERNGGRSNQQGRQAQGRKADGGNNFWTDSVLIPCADGKYRRVPGRVAESANTIAKNGNLQRKRIIGLHEAGGCGNGGQEGAQRKARENHLEIEPALFPLASGLPSRVGLLRGAGNSIVPQVAAEFIRAFMECEQHQQDREL